MRNCIVLMCGLVVMIMLSSCQTTRSGMVPHASFDNVSQEVINHNDQAHDDLHVGRIASAMEHYDQALKLSPKNPEVMYNLSQLYTTRWKEIMELRGWDDAKMYDECVRLSRTAAKGRPNDFIIWRDYGQVAFTAYRFGIEPDWREAAKVWGQTRKCAKTPTQTLDTWLFEARAHINAGDHKKAKDCLEEGLKINPNSQIATNLLQKISV
ncbi:MAG: tetratricopeptide repeat protein [Candidatus Pacebacteria bacterium]|nr:tetratricopeptide repeat protein [Candidatus Paceibacterota bacterium]